MGTLIVEPQGDGIQLYLGDLSVLHIPGSHDSSPDVLQNAVAHGPVFAAVIHVASHLCIQGHLPVDVGVIGLKAHGLRLKQEVSQAVQDQTALARSAQAIHGVWTLRQGA